MSFVNKFFSHKEMQEEPKWFVSDNPIVEKQDDKFQTSQVSDLILQSLSHQQLPIHIAVFGPWGSGKTSVLKLLEDRLKNDPNYSDKYEIRFLSVWKFADDAPSLHRKIVREVERELKIPNPEGLDRETVFTKSLQLKGWSTLLADFVTKNNYWLIGLIYFAVTAIFSTWSSIYKTTFQSILFIVSLLFVNRDSIQRTHSSTTKATPLTHGDQYEERFTSAVEKYLKSKKGKKLILVFDDLDRLPPKQLVAALNTTKTFLRSQQCAFIIPCDERTLRDGINEVLESTIKKNKDSSDSSSQSPDPDWMVSEYLTKTFDLIFKLPALEQTNMKRYARRLLQEQKIIWASDSQINIDRILGILIHSGIKTPRQVKNTLNTFAMDWQLANRRDAISGKKLLTQDPITLSIFSVLKSDFPTFYSRITTDPFLLLNFDNENDQNLKSFISRVLNHLPQDPRYYVYFSNEQLNPIAGKPLPEKAKQHLINNQSEKFLDVFNTLSEDDKKLVFTALIADLDHNAGVEIENCLRVMLETNSTSYISNFDSAKWDEIVRENATIFLEFSLLEICQGLSHLAPHPSTWKMMGKLISIQERFDEVVPLWISHSDFIDQLQIDNLATSIPDIAIEKQQGYALLNTIKSLIVGHPMTSIDWLILLDKTLESEENPTQEEIFILNDWFLSWANATGQTISSSLILKSIKTFSFKNPDTLNGVGTLWNQVTSEIQNLTNIKALFDLFIQSKSHAGFTIDDLKLIARTIAKEEATSNLLDDFLSKWWEIDADEAMLLLDAWSDLPGIVDFCYQTVGIDMDEKYQNRMIDILINRDDEFIEFEGMFKYINEKINASGTHKFILSFARSERWRTEMKGQANTWIPIASPNIWFSWGEDVIRQKVELFWEICRDMPEKLAEFQNGINHLAITAKGYGNNIGSSGNTQVAQRYLNILFKSQLDNIHLTDLQSDIKKWNEITIPGLQQSVSLIDTIDVPTRDALLLALHTKCNMSDSVYNLWLSKYADFTNTRFQEAAVQRWAYLNETERKEIISRLGEPEYFVNLLISWAKNNPVLSMIAESISWSLDESSKYELITAIVSSCHSHEINAWFSDTLDYLNQNGEEKWRISALLQALNVRDDFVLPSEIVLSTALGMKDSRAKIGLMCLKKFPLTKSKANKIKERIQVLEELYPELVIDIKKYYNWKWRKSLSLY